MISSNDITKNKLQWAMADTFIQYIDTPGVIIVNTDLSTGNGIHWLTAIIYSNRNVFFIDPLGPNNNRPYDNIMFQGLNDYLFYPYKFQMNTSIKCGYFTIFSAKLAKSRPGISPQQITQMLVQYFGKSADKEDEKILEKAFGTNK